MKRGPYKKKPLEERFWEKVDRRGPDDCWEWTAGKNNNGYGMINEGGRGRALKAHRLSYEFHNGPIPNGLHVLHSCDNPGCVNTRHLHLGTHADNMKEMKERGRSNGGGIHGELHGMSKLTNDEVKQIRNEYASGKITQQKLAIRFGVNQTKISDIVTRKTWRHL